jgi:hypothetical protein
MNHTRVSELADIESAARRLAGNGAALGPPVLHGRNSRVFPVTVGGETRYAAKVYAPSSPGQSDRMQTEFNALGFLWRSGFTDIPRPIGQDASAHVALYSWVRGQRVAGADVTRADIQAAAEFLLRMRDASLKAGATGLPPAAEACFSLPALEANLMGRVSRLASVEPAASSSHAGCREFLDSTLIPALDGQLRHARQEVLAAGLDPDIELPQASRTLSPSDFGFHNCLRSDSGGLVFLDFEYFGWDDPAKMIADFLLHPAMQIASQLRAEFTRLTVPRLPDTARLQKVLPAYYPLFRTKWALILLNEFLPEGLARRRHAGGGAPAVSIRAQLEKAKAMIAGGGLPADYLPRS